MAAVACLHQSSTLVKMLLRMMLPFIAFRTMSCRRGRVSCIREARVRFVMDSDGESDDDPSHPTKMKHDLTLLR